MIRHILTSLFCLLLATGAAAQLIPFRTNNKVGYQDSAGLVVVPPHYDAGSDMQGGYAVVMRGHLKGFINARGEEVISCRYEDASLFVQGLACVQQEGRFGYIDPAGSWAIPPMYENAFSFRNGLARVRRQGGWGMIDRQGAVIVPFTYQRLEDCTAGLIAASPDGTAYGYLDARGKVAIDFRYKLALPFDEATKLAIAENRRGLYYIDTRGRIIKEVKTEAEEEIERERRLGIKERH